MVSVLRLVIALVVAVLLGRSAALAWRNRRLAWAVWRRIRLPHVAGAGGLLVVVLGVAFGLMALVPATGIGLGSFLGLSGNAIFAPLEEATQRAAGDPSVAPAGGAAAAPGGASGLLVPPGTDVTVVLAACAFLVLLLVLFPWLAYVEERVFREGLEAATGWQEAWAALRFGLLHLVMLIPIAAALAIGVAGFAYGRVYRSAYQRALQRRSTTAGPFGPVLVAPTERRARAEAVLTSTVWHTTFNSLIVLLVLTGLVLEWVAALG